MRTLFVCMTAVLAVAAGAGCGYRIGPMTRADVRTVHVAIFDNETFRRGLEVELTDAVRKELRRRTQLGLVGRDRAASLLTGRIVRVREKVIARDSAGDILKKDVTVYVDFEWRDLRSGVTLARGVRVCSPGRQITSRGQTVATATTEAVDDAAQAIVDLMEGNW